MLIEPQEKRLFTLFDCQNLFHACKNAWGYQRANFDPLKLSRLLQRDHLDWKFEKTHLYTGIHRQDIHPELHHFWTKKLELLEKSPQVTCVTRPLRYTECDGKKIAREKGIDVRIALDLVRLARTGAFDVAVIFSQDNDFREVADEIRAIAKEFDRWIKIVSAFPDASGPNNLPQRGIEHTDWIRISKKFFTLTFGKVMLQKLMKEEILM